MDHTILPKSKASSPVYLFGVVCLPVFLGLCGQRIKLQWKGMAWLLNYL